MFYRHQTLRAKFPSTSRAIATTWVVTVAVATLAPALSVRVLAGDGPPPGGGGPVPPDHIFYDFGIGSVDVLPRADGHYDVEVTVGVAPEAPPVHPLDVRLFADDETVADLTIDTLGLPGVTCCTSTCPVVPGFTFACTGECPFPNVSTPRVCVYSKTVSATRLALAPGSTLRVVVDPDLRFTELGMADGSMPNEATASVPQPPARNAFRDFGVSSARVIPISGGRFDVELEITVVPEFAPSQDLEVELLSGGNLVGQLSVPTAGLPGASCCVSTCAVVPGYTFSCEGTCPTNPQMGVCTYKRTERRENLPLTPDSDLIIVIDPDGLLTESADMSPNSVAVPVPDPTPQFTPTPWYENFDDYQPGADGWQGWDDDPAFWANSSPRFARSGTHSLEVDEEDNALREFHLDPDDESTFWSFSAWQYIPSEFESFGGGDLPGSYFILLNTYHDGGPYHTSAHLRFDSTDGMIKISTGDSGNTVDTPYVTDRWVRIQTIVDTDTDWTHVYYDGELVTEYSWTGGILGDGGGALDIAAVDLFANGSSPVYYDDLTLEPIDALPPNLCGSAWSESFESYPLAGIAHKGGWDGWDDDASFDGTVTETTSRSGTQALVVAGDTDIVRELCWDPADDSRWLEFSAWQYIPSDFASGGEEAVAGSYFMLLNTYGAGGPYHWSLQMQFDSNDGRLKVFHGNGADNIEHPYVTQRWTRIQAIVDRDDDWTRVYYDGDLVAEYSWTGGVLGEGGGAMDIAAVDLFANGSSPIYYDDLRLERIEAPPAPVISFHRGDPNNDGQTDLSDAVFILGFLFLGGAAPSCLESANVNDDTEIDLSDSVYLLSFLFLGGLAPPAPGSTTAPCGEDPASSPSFVGCAAYAFCE